MDFEELSKTAQEMFQSVYIKEARLFEKPSFYYSEWDIIIYSNITFSIFQNI